MNRGARGATQIFRAKQCISVVGILANDAPVTRPVDAIVLGQKGRRVAGRRYMTSETMARIGQSELEPTHIAARCIGRPKSDRTDD